MNLLSLFIFLSLLTIIHTAYNPIPIGAIIISTISKIFVMQPAEYGGTDDLDIIFTATTNMTIVNTVYDSVARNLYIIFSNTTNGTLYLCQLDSLEQLDSTVYQLPIIFDIANINQLNSFSSDVINRRVFLTDQNGTVHLFSMSGLLGSTISTPMSITNRIRSVAYTDDLNQLFIITDATVDACTNLDTDNLQCCEGLPRASQLRSITFDEISGDLYVYVLDEKTGIYQVVLNSSGCPTALRPINTLGVSTNLQFVIDRGLYFASGSAQNGIDNSVLVIANGTQNPRYISIGVTIVALHISYPNTQPIVNTVETCFHGITYGTYRAAVILAALFGTIMGIFMCFNALFCIDFFMTKRIIRGLKQQIPHNLLEDRWNKLVEEKYAKIALEKQRKQNDPPPRRKSSLSGRKSSLSGRKNSSAATASNNNNNNTQASEDGAATSDSLQVPNPIPKLSAYLRRKSEGYLSRRRSDDYRNQRQQPREGSYEVRAYPQRNQATTTAQVHIGSVMEESETGQGIRPNLSRRALLKNDEDFL